MKVTNQQLLNANAGLGELLELDVSDVKTAYGLAKNKRKVEQALQDYREVSKRLVDKYTVKDEDGNPVITDTEEYEAKVSELLDQETDVDVWPIKLEALEDIEFKPIVLYWLDWMIIDAEDKTEAISE